MNRLNSTIQLDLKVQARNKFYHVSALVAILISVGLRQVPTEFLAGLIPTTFLFGVAGTTYLYAGSLILFEKGERTLDSVIVTPLRLREYLNSKLITLTGLATIESLIIVLFSYGFGFNWLLLIAGLVSMGLLYTLSGLIMVARYDAITKFLMPSILYLVIITIPFLQLIIDHPLTILFYLWPTQGPFLLMIGSFEPLAWWQLIYAFIASLSVIIGGYWWAYQAFDKYIIRGES